MIIFFGDGRVGNQIFQYAFIKNFLRTKELLLTCNFKELLELFDIKDNVVNLQNRYVRIICRRFFSHFFNFLVKVRIISGIYIQREIIGDFDVSGDTYIIKRGLLPIKYIYPAFFQSEKFFDKKKVRDVSIRKEHFDKANKYIRDLPPGKRIFIHVRRGDYNSHTILGQKGVLLPESYYEKQIRSFLLKNRDCFFIFLSDDVDYVEKNYGWVKNSTISRNNMYVDFAIMTLCDGGILSNSSFSWWGAYFCEGMEGFIAPQYWLGFKSKKEYPVGIYPSFAKIGEV